VHKGDDDDDDNNNSSNKVKELQNRAGGFLERSLYVFVHSLQWALAAFRRHKQ